MPNTLSIRSYSQKKVKHSHSFHQIVLPLRGVINIELYGFKGKVTPGECVIIKAGNAHLFTADAEARFVVADMNALPENIFSSNATVFLINQPLLHFLSFVEAQFESQINQELEQLCYQTFFALLTEQKFFTQIDRRIREVIQYIEAHITNSLAIEQLANIACLSPTQFKKLFKIQIGLTTTQYVIHIRMEKAQALLIHTDYPVQVIAEQVGYTDYTAFSRRFSQHFGLSPSKLSR
jgi:AraC-like DNA-binding protein